MLDAPLRLTGYEQIPSRVAYVPEPDAVLCRSNGGAIVRVIDALGQGRRAALVGGVRTSGGWPRPPAVAGRHAHRPPGAVRIPHLA
ncbi:hypothetical protein NKG94_34650 [Micromonospora sp. M12]